VIIFSEQSPLYYYYSSIIRDPAPSDVDALHFRTGFKTYLIGNRSSDCSHTSVLDNDYIFTGKINTLRAEYYYYRTYARIYGSWYCNNNNNRCRRTDYIAVNYAALTTGWPPRGFSYCFWAQAIRVHCCEGITIIVTYARTHTYRFLVNLVQDTRTRRTRIIISKAFVHNAPTNLDIPAHVYTKYV
jgi:hypothetical protein